MKKNIISGLAFIIIPLLQSYGQIGGQMRYYQKCSDVFQKQADIFSTSSRDIFIPPCFYENRKEMPGATNSGRTAKQCLDSAIIVIPDTADQWQLWIKFRYIYDSSCHNITEVESGWNQDSSRWQDVLKYNYSYNSSGTISGIIDYLLVDSTGQWVYDEKVDYTYNSSDERIQLVIYQWDETVSDWKEYNKGEYTYNADGNLSEIFGYEWNENSGMWVNDFKYKYIYENPGSLDYKVLYVWDLTINQWTNDALNDYLYDDNNNLTQDIYYSWWESDSLWVAWYREDNEYDSLGNFSQNTQYYWDPEVESWILNARFGYLYNNDFSLEDLLLPDYMFEDGSAELYFQHQLVEIDGSHWSIVIEDWLPLPKMLFYYSTFETIGISEIKDETVELFPNPADDFLHLEANAYLTDLVIILYDLQGRKVLENEISTNDRLFVGNLKSGFYLFSLRANNFSQTGKIVIH